MNFIHDRLLYDSNSNNLSRISEIINSNKIAFGSGGSNNFIVILNNKAVLKIIPRFIKDPNMIRSPDNDQTEIEFYKLFFTQLIKKSVTPHIVGFYDNFTLLDISAILPASCPSINDKLLIKPGKIDLVKNNLCHLKQLKNHDLIEKTADVIVLENCPLFIDTIITILIQSKKFDIIENLIYRVIFQIIYTLTAIQHYYPTFVHNDLFMRNILAKSESKYTKNDFVEYIYNDISYYLPANGIYTKINDFGYSIMPPLIYSRVLYDTMIFNPDYEMTYDDNKRDIYTFLYDFYNGENMGHISTMELLRPQSNKVKKRMKNIFAQFIDIGTIDKISSNNKYLLNKQWNIKDVPLLRNTVKQPKEYFDSNVFDRYKHIPKNSNIVRTFHIK